MSTVYGSELVFLSELVALKFFYIANNYSLKLIIHAACIMDSARSPDKQFFRNVSVTIKLQLYPNIVKDVGGHHPSISR